MRKLIAALAAAGLFLISGCDHKTAAVAAWEQPSAEPIVTFPALPTGLIATAEIGDRTELRDYSATDGRLLRRFALPPVTGAVAFSDDYGYAADTDSITHEIHFSVRTGDAFRPVTDWNFAMLGIQDPGDLKVRAGAFVPGTDRYAVEVVRPIEGDAEVAHVSTVSFDPAQPMTTMRDDALPDAAASAAEGQQTFSVPVLHADVIVVMTDRSLVSADILGLADSNGRRDYLFTCAGPQIGKFELACVGSGKKAELGALTLPPQQSTAEFRSLGKVPGKPFTAVFPSPDGKRLLAQRADGFYALPVTGGTPKKIFGPLNGGNITFLN
jgi:hypothetical protein